MVLVEAYGKKESITTTISSMLIAACVDLSVVTAEEGVMNCNMEYALAMRCGYTMAMCEERRQARQSTASVVMYGRTWISVCAAGEQVRIRSWSMREVESVGPPSPHFFMYSVRLKVMLPVFTVSVGSTYRVVSDAPSSSGDARYAMLSVIAADTADGVCEFSLFIKAFH